MDTKQDGKASPIHAEIKLLVRTSENGRESVEIRSLKEVVVPPPPAVTSAVSSVSASPIPPPPLSPLASQRHTKRDDDTLSPTDSTKIYEDDFDERVESPILTQKLVVRFQEGEIISEAFAWVVCSKLVAKSWL